MIAYRLTSSMERVIFDDAVIGCFAANRQLDARSPESGGQLFARLDPPNVFVTRATEPKKQDRRRRFSFWPSRHSERLEIMHMHGRGLHYVGDWHTHPEPRGWPSTRDLQSIGETVRLSKHRLGGFLLVVVGREAPPEGLTVHLHDGATAHLLQPEET